MLLAPGLPNLDAVGAAVSKPVNLIGYMQNGTLTIAQLTEVGVTRISLATGLYRRHDRPAR